MKIGKKNKNRLIYGTMTLVLCLQTLFSVITPVVVYGDTTTENEAVTLEKASVKDKTHVELKVKVKATADETAAIQVASDLAVSQVKWADGTKNTPLTWESAVKKIQLAVKKTDTYTATIVLTTAENTSDAAQDVTFTLGDQTVKTSIAAVPTATSSSQTSTSTSSATTSTPTSTEQSASATSATSSTASSTTGTSTTESTTTSSSTTTKRVTRAAAASTDIRTYFPSGDGTILTDGNVVYLDKDGNVLNDPIPADATVRVYYKWSIPEDVRKQIQPGDTFNFKIPDELKVVAPKSGDLKNADGEVYAHYTIDADGNVQFVFNENVQNESTITGDFFFDTEFNQEHIDGPGETTIDFPEEDNLPPIDVDIKPTTDKEIDKKGDFDQTPNPTSVNWTVDINQAMNDLSNPKVTEHWPEGITYQSVKVYKLVMNFDGTVKEVGEELTPDQYTVDANGNVTVKGDTSDAYRIVYDTKIEDSAKPSEGGDVQFDNRATLSDDTGTDIDAKASVTNTYGKMLEKDQAGYDAANQTFSWSIKYNYGEKTIPQNQAVITDTMGDNLELVADSVVLHKISFDKNGKEIVGEELSSPGDYTLEKSADGKSFVVKFADDVDAAVKIDYKTKVDTIVSGDTAVNNKVSTDTGETAEDHGTAKQQGVIKTLGDVDYANKLASWKIQVNKNQYQMNDFVLKDTYSPSPGLQMNTVDGVPDLTITDNQTKATLVAGTDYDLVATKDAEGNETGFTIAYKGDYAKTDHSFEINYRTKFDITILDPNDPNNDAFRNTASIDWSDTSNNKEHSDSDTDFKPDYSYSLNARKSGTYNAVTKEITWSIAVNLSNNELEDAFLTDAIKENQSYVKGSLTVYEAKTNADGTVEKTSDTPVNDSMKKVEEPASGNNQTFRVDFPNGTKTYLIEFKTSLADKVIDDSSAYDNVADYSNGGISRDVNGEVSIENGGSFVQKTGEQDADDPNYVNWHATINPSQSTLHDVVITDNPSENQVLDEDSIQLYEMTVAEDGTLTVNKDKPLTKDTDYSVAITTDNVTGKQTLTVKLLHEIDQAYQMEYRSFITSSTSAANDTISNDVSITAEGSKTIDDQSGKDVIVPVDHSGGNANGKKGTITLQKTEADGTTPLTGVTFQLWDTTKTHMLREGTVDDKGQITFGGLPQGEYLLVEANAPDGYVIDDDLAAGRKIKIDDATSATNAVTVIKNQTNKLVLTKTNEAGENLAGAQFKLEHFDIDGVNGAYWHEVALKNNTTDANGQLETDQLEPGIYRLTETKAPDGYLLNRSPRSFIVKKNATISEQTTSIKFVDYQGSATLTKTDEAGDPLAGAVFKVVNAAGEEVASNLITDAQGVVTATGLAPGKYAFVETKAPSGYILNTAKTEFEIAASAVAKPAVVKASAEFVNYKGSAELTKVNADGDALAGATFNVVDADGKIVAENLTSNAEGKVKVTDLAPGKYQFVETKAPDGYLINTQRLAFTIADEANGAVTTVDAGKFVDYKGAFSLTKVNTSEETLAGAEFTLYDANKESLNKTVTSNADGKVTFKDLAPGTYYYQETKAPSVADGTPYVLNPALIKVEIPSSYEGDPKVLNFGDFQNFKGKVEVTKVGDGSGSIAGAKFVLYQIVDGNDTKIRDITVPEDGKLNLDDLGAGSYKLVETQAAPGYVTNAQPIYFVVNENDDENQEIDGLNYPNYQQEIEGTKVDAEGNPLAGAVYQIFAADATNQPTGEALSLTNKAGEKATEFTTDQTGSIYAKGIEIGHYVIVEKTAPEGYILDTTPHAFDVETQIGKPEPIELGDFNNYQGSISFTKTDDSGKGLAGAEFSVLDATGKTVQEGIASDKDGHVKVENLAPGNYQLQETKAPTGYILNSQKVAFTIAGSAAGKPATVELADVVNYQGSISFTKTDDSGKGLAGAEFSILDKDGKAVQTGVTSNADGNVTVENLAPGDYQLAETKAPTGYILNSQKVAFTIGSSASGKPVTVALDDIVNYQGSISFTKTDASGKGLAGAEFSILDKDGKAVQTGVTSNADGNVTVENLAPGDYQLAETKAPTGYILNTERTDFTIEASVSGKPETVTLDDVVNYQGSISFTKTDDSGKGLAGAEFSILDKDGKAVQTGVTSNADGNVTVENLAPGAYQLAETKAPTGYILNSQKVAFTIGASASGKPETVALDDVVNYQGSVVLTKTNDAGKPLAGAVFTLQTTDGKVVETGLTTDKDGKLTYQGLAPGTYQFTETKAPTGYQLAKKGVSFTIEAEVEGKPDTVAVGPFINTEVPPASSTEESTTTSTTVAPTQDPGSTPKGGLPQTNETQGNKTWMIGGAVLIVGVIGFLVYRRRKKE